jgi:predicted O-methyltransferase YrrM
MEFLPQAIDSYATEMSAPESPVLAELNRNTWIKSLYPRMLSGHLQGRILSFLSNMLRPRRILEIGTFTGYSCICLAEGLQEDGKIITIDINNELEPMIRPALEKAGIQDKVMLHFGNALEIVPQLEETFDLVFIDADKENYLTYYHKVFPKIRIGGVILADNVLWSGKVLEENTTDKETLGIKAFNSFVQQDERAEQVLLPVRDGIMMIRKISA